MQANYVVLLLLAFYSIPFYKGIEGISPLTLTRLEKHSMTVKVGAWKDSHLLSVPWDHSIMINPGNLSRRELRS